MINEDTISRQAALRELKNCIKARLEWNSDSREERQGLNVAICAIEDLPSAQQDTSEYQTIAELQKEVAYWHELSNSYEQTIVRLTEAASAQPQITECEHCLAYDPFKNEIDGFCRKMGKVMCVSDFCSYAERRIDG